MLVLVSSVWSWTLRGRIARLDCAEEYPYMTKIPPVPSFSASAKDFKSYSQFSYIHIPSLPSSIYYKAYKFLVNTLHPASSTSHTKQIRHDAQPHQRLYTVLDLLPGMSNFSTNPSQDANLCITVRNEE